MRFLYKVLSVALIGLGLTQGAVVPLEPSNFDSTIAASELSLVEFFAPWCGHCKALEPKYKAASEELEGVALLASVDCTVHNELCTKYGVRGFPTLKVFSSGSTDPVEYNGGRETNEIVSYMKRQKAPAYRVVSAEEQAQLAQSEEVLITGYFASETEAAAQTFINVAKALRNEYTFAVVIDSNPSSTVSLSKKNDETSNLDKADFTEDELKAFISAEAFPLVGEIGPENYQKYVDRGLPLVWLFVDYNADVTTGVLAAAADAAKEYKGKLSIVKLDGIRWGEHAKHFGLSGATPGIVLEDRATGKNFIFPQDAEVSATGLKSHFSGFFDKSLQPNVKSEPIPESQTGPVYVIVGKTFDQVVNDPERDVLVEFYAPWCGHCKSLAPKYDKLGEMFQEDAHVRIAKVDATANDVPANIRGFPTIMLYKATDKANPISYDGERTEAAMADFVREHSSFKNAAAASETHDEL